MTWVFGHFWLVLGVVIAVYLILKAVIVVGGTETAVLERKFFGRRMPQGRVIALAREIGIRAQTLGPDLHFPIPFLYIPTKFPFTNILEDEIGLVESIDGEAISPGKIFATVVEGHNSFQDGEQFLINGGEKGPQIQLLPPGMYRVNPILFKVRKVPVTIIDKGKIGIVTSMDGQSIQSGRLLAKKVEAHSNRGLKQAAACEDRS